jgi:hypothetical protein
MFMLDRPLVPKYTKNLGGTGSISSATSGISSLNSSHNGSIRSTSTVTTVCSVPPKINGKTSSRASSAASIRGPYQTDADDLKKNNHRYVICINRPFNVKSAPSSAIKVPIKSFQY